MQDKNYYEQRYVSKSIGISSNWFNNDDDNKTLLDIISEYDKVVLLGNPGIGKTKELAVLFENLWDEKNITGRIPFSINLKNFRKINRFEDLIVYPDWKTLSSIIFILDGLDEIAEIQDFISAFELFISQNRQLNIKYVISCRTNIYEKYLVNISNFESFYLQELSFEQSVSLLSNKYGVDIEKYRLSEKHSNYLKTPFFLELFSSYILDKGILPVSDSEMWELFVEKSLDKYEEKQSKKVLIDRTKLVIDLKKVAFTNELMQQNFSSAEELSKITGDYLQYIENPFTIELSGEPRRWNFLHRQIQEYLVAKTLKDKTFEEIRSIIKIPNIDTEVIHPSLFNTITFLINLLDKGSDEFKQLINWLKTNQIEILFRADSDRTDSFKVKVFQHYFVTECIDKKLWISTNRTFSVKEIAEFGDCQENFEYLVNLINDRNHFRVVISALNLMSFFKPDLKRIEQLKPLFIELLKSLNTGSDVKSEIIRCIHSLKIWETDDLYLDEIFSVFKTETNKEINASLLFLLSDKENVERFFGYIKAEFLRDLGIEKRKDLDEVHRGNDWKLRELILKLQNTDHFIELFSFYFFDNARIDFYNNYTDRLLKKCLFFSNKESDFIVRFLKSINKKTDYFRQEQLLLDIISKSASNLKAAEYLLDNNEFSAIYFFLSRIANADIIQLIKNRFENTSISIQDANNFRNYLWHNNRNLSYEFDTLMSDNGFAFDSPLPSIVELEEQKNNIAEKVQSNFDILFDQEELLKNIKTIYDESKTDVLDKDDLIQISSKWYRNNNHAFYIDPAITVLQSLNRNFGSLTFSEVSEHLKNVWFIFNLILNQIKGNTRENFKFVVSSEQQKIIIDWCIESAKSIDFNNVIQLYEDNSFSCKNDYLKFETILAFQKHFEFSLPKDFLLNSLEYYEIKNFDQNDDFLIFLYNQIDDKEQFEEKVIDNILNKKLFSFVLDRHIEYALKNKLKQTFPKIREYFLTQKKSYNLDKKLELYLNLTNDVELLKECCSDVNDPICWSAIKLLALRKEESFCIAKSIKYLDQDELTRKDYFTSNAMWVLFHFKSIKALEYYLDLPNFDFHNVNFSDYSTIEDYSILKTLFYRIFKEVYDRSDFSYSNTFFEAYVSNLSRKSDDSYTKTQEVLRKIKEELIAQDSDTRLFMINLLIDNSKNSYINSKSVPLTFKDALQKVETILN